MRADFTTDDIPSVLMRGSVAPPPPARTDRRAMSWERYLEIMLAGLRAPA